MRSPHPPRSQRRTRRQAVAAVACSLLAVTAVQLSTTAAGAASWWGTTTTTRKATTTTTKKPTTTTTAKPTTTTTTPPPTCGGVTTVAKADGSGTWTCSFGDEFSGSSLDRTKWIPQTTYSSGYSSAGQDCYLDAPGNVAVANGELQLTSRKEANPFTCRFGNLYSYQTQVSSGMVSTYGRFAQMHGRWEIRAKVVGATGPGLHSALWLTALDPDKYGDEKYASGEIDIAEMFSQYPDKVVPSIHYTGANVDPSSSTWRCTIADVSQFHTYVMEWTATSIKIFYDDQLCLEDPWSPVSPQTGRQPFDQPFILGLTQALGTVTNLYDSATTPLPASTVIDYVRVYK